MGHAGEESMWGDAFYGKGLEEQTSAFDSSFNSLCLRK